jgi:hypothetical protein
VNRRRTFLGFFLLALAWSSWQSLMYDCSGAVSCRPSPPKPWADPLVVVPAALLLVDLLGQRVRS